jgi:hypothetical protein
MFPDKLKTTYSALEKVSEGRSSSFRRRGRDRGLIFSPHVTQQQEQDWREK